MNISYAPIVSEAKQPDNFVEVLDEIELMFKVLKLSWQHPKIIDFVRRLHIVAKWTPPNEDIARFSLSYAQLQCISSKLQEYRWNPELGYGEKFETVDQQLLKENP